MSASFRRRLAPKSSAVTLTGRRYPQFRRQASRKCLQRCPCLKPVVEKKKKKKKIKMSYLNLLYSPVCGTTALITSPNDNDSCWHLPTTRSKIGRSSMADPTFSRNAVPNPRNSCRDRLYPALRRAIVFGSPRHSIRDPAAATLPCRVVLRRESLPRHWRDYTIVGRCLPARRHFLNRMNLSSSQ